MNKTMEGFGSCTPEGFSARSKLRIAPWGIVWHPPFVYGGFEGPVCPEKIISIFRRSDVTPHIRWSKPRWASTFRKTHPDLFKKYEQKTTVKFPCDDIDVEEISRWGSTRGVFKKLVSRMAAGIRMSRDQDCDSGSGDAVVIKDINFYLTKHAVATSALNYLSGVAYANFFCLDPDAKIQMPRD